MHVLLTYGIPNMPADASPYAVLSVKYPVGDGGIPTRSPVSDEYPYVPNTGTTYSPAVAGAGGCICVPWL